MGWKHPASRFLVLEFLDGETLADRIARGPIPVEESLKLAFQIAEALEAAHHEELQRKGPAKQKEYDSAS
jgi:hypothetical protein